MYPITLCDETQKRFSWRVRHLNMLHLYVFNTEMVADDITWQSYLKTPCDGTMLAHLCICSAWIWSFCFPLPLFVVVKFFQLTHRTLSKLWIGLKIVICLWVFSYRSLQKPTCVHKLVDIAGLRVRLWNRSSGDVSPCLLLWRLLCRGPEGHFQLESIQLHSARANRL